MYRVVALFVFMCLATANADHHQHCHSPNMTGLMSVMSLKGEIKAYGIFTYDSTANKLRFRSNESFPTNHTLGLDLLMFFDEGIFYEIDSKTQSCVKKSLQSTAHPLEIPDDAKSYGTITAGSRTVEGDGIKVNIWVGPMSEGKGIYSMSVTMGCLPMSTFYFTEPTSFLVSLMGVEYEIKDPDLLIVPSFCENQPLEETPEGTVNSFLNEFM